MEKDKDSGADRLAEREIARRFYQHVSKEQEAVMLAVTLAVCALPMLLGVRLWDSIPELVHTGLIGPNGADDSLPRAAVVFALPGLMCLLDLITHVQLMVSRRRMTLPKTHIRLMGRWGFPVLSIFFCGIVILRSAGTATPWPLLALCALGLALMLLGSRLWDSAHRLAGVFLLIAGYLTVTAAFLMDVSGHVSN